MIANTGWLLRRGSLRRFHTPTPPPSPRPHQNRQRHTAAHTPRRTPRYQSPPKQPDQSPRFPTPPNTPPARAAAEDQWQWPHAQKYRRTPHRTRRLVPKTPRNGYRSCPPRQDQDQTTPPDPTLD